MTDTNETQAIQSVETTKTILTENFINEEKNLTPTQLLWNNMNSQQVF